jgi:uncharacterized protein (DUF2384 family)
MSATVTRKTRDSIALKAFFKIADKWSLTPPEQMQLLGDIPSSTFYKYKETPEGASIGTDMMDRLSYILGIYKDLQILFSNENSVNQWVKKPNSALPFNGRTALDVMCKEHVVGLYTVRQYLAAQRGV